MRSLMLSVAPSGSVRAGHFGIAYIVYSFARTLMTSKDRQRLYSEKYLQSLSGGALTTLVQAGLYNPGSNTNIC